MQHPADAGIKGSQQAEIGRRQAPENAALTIAHPHRKAPQATECRDQCHGCQETEQEGVDLGFRAKATAQQEHPHAKIQGGHHGQDGRRPATAGALYACHRQHHRRQHGAEGSDLIPPLGSCQQFHHAGVTQHHCQQDVRHRAHNGAGEIHFIAVIVTGLPGQQPKEHHRAHAQQTQQDPRRMEHIVKALAIHCGVVKPHPQRTAGNGRKQHKTVRKFQQVFHVWFLHWEISVSTPANTG